MRFVRQEDLPEEIRSIKFKGCYHGHSDGLLVQAGSAALTQSVPDSSGVPASFAQQT